MFGFKIATIARGGHHTSRSMRARCWWPKTRRAVEIETSRQASAQFDDAPMFPEVATTVFRSLWQLDLVAIRIRQFINWGRVRTGAVRVLTGVNYV